MVLKPLSVHEPDGSANRMDEPRARHSPLLFPPKKRSPAARVYRDSQTLSEQLHHNRLPLLSHITVDFCNHVYSLRRFQERRQGGCPRGQGHPQDGCPGFRRHFQACQRRKSLNRHWKAAELISHCSCSTRTSTTPPPVKKIYFSNRETS